MQKDLKALFGDHHGLDEKSIEALTNELVANNLPGFDYIEYKQALGSLLNMDMDEETAFKSAFATAATVGLTKDKLVKTAEHYKGILNKENEKFNRSVQRQLAEKVKNKQQEVEKLKNQIEKYKAKIAELEGLVAKHQDTVDHADENIQAAKDKIQGAKDNFEYTLNSILNQIDKDIDNINKYL